MARPNGFDDLDWRIGQMGNTDTDSLCAQYLETLQAMRESTTPEQDWQVLGRLRSIAGISISKLYKYEGR